jgi:hypothetical protein
MGFVAAQALLSVCLFGGMLLLLEIGRRVGIRHLAGGRDDAASGTSTAEGAVFALFGLLIAFTFSGAAGRFDDRRRLVIEEANAIGTAYLRIDLLSADAQPSLRDSFRGYLDSRIETYRKVPDMDAVGTELAKSAELQRTIWHEAVAATKTEPTTAAAMLLLPAVNSMIDLTTTRTMATRMHPPNVVYVMLFALAYATSFLAGYGMRGAGVHDRLHMVGFAAAVALTVFVIIDIEYPRLGLIRVDAFDQALVELRASMD